MFLFFVVIIVFVIIFIVVAAEGVGVEDADKAVFESSLSEVDDESEFEVRSAEGRAECVAIGSGHIVVVGFDVEEEAVFDEEVSADSTDDFFVELDFDFVVNGVCDFFDGEFFDKRFLVDLERVSWPKFFVNFDRATDEAAR